MNSNVYGLKTMFFSAIMIFAQSGWGLTLQQCRDLAIKNNVTVTNAQLEVKSADQTKRSVFTKFFPSVDAQLFSFWTKDPLVNFKIPGMDLPVYDGNMANLENPSQFAYVPQIPVSALDKGTFGVLSATQPVFAGGRIINGYKLANVGKEVNELKLVLAQNEVVFNAEQYYWQIVALQEKHKTLDAYGVLLDTLYKEASDAFNAGLIYRNDLLKILLKQSEIQSDSIKLDNGMKLAEKALCQYTGIPDDSLMSLDDSTLVYNAPEDVYIDPDSALVIRPEYDLLIKSLKAEKLQTQLKIGEYLPQIGIGASGLYMKDLGNDGTNGFVFASAKLPVSAWWEAAHSISERKIRESIVEKNKKNNMELLKLQIDKTWNELNELYKQISVAGKKLEQASENLKLNRDNYNAGLINISDMLEAQTILKTAEDDLLDSKINYKIKLISYLQATGR